MKYQLQYRNGDEWKQSRIHKEIDGKLFDTLGELLQAVDNSDESPSTLDDYRIRKIPEQPEEQVLE